MRYFIFGLIILPVTELYSQVYRKHFYDIEGEETDSVSAYYYEAWTSNPISEIQVITYYSQSNSLKCNEGIKDENGETRRTYYYPNGAIKLEGRFKGDTPKGLIRSYYPNGEFQSELLFEDYDIQKNKNQVVGIINYWDSLDNKIVDIGRGFCNCILTPFIDKPLFEKGHVVDGLKIGEWEGQSEDHQYSFVETYDRGVLLQGKQNYKGSFFNYDRLEIPASPQGDLGTFYEHIRTIMKYPLLARRKGIQGKVFLEFVVEKDGSLTHIEIVKGIGEGCDEEAIRAVSSAPRWNNAVNRGRPIKQRMMLPIIFKLG